MYGHMYVQERRSVDGCTAVLEKTKALSGVGGTATAGA